MKRIIWTIAAALVPCALAWLGGFDFNVRGSNTAALGLSILLAAVWAWLWPWWGDE